MSEQTVAVEIPQPLYRRLQRLAEVTHKPITDLVAQAIDLNLPPLPDNLSPDMQEALSGMETWPDDALWNLARSHVSAADQARYAALLEQERSGGLNETEAAELENLYHAFNVHMLRKAYACALLKWRGYALPSPTDLNSAD